MNRIFFFVSTGLSSLVLLLLIANVVLAKSVGTLQGQTQLAQSDINQAQAFQSNLRQLALRIYQDAQKSQDPALKDIVSRQQITFTPSATDSTTPAPTK